MPSSHPSAVVLVPNLELSYQVGDVFRTILGANVCLVSRDIPMRLKDTEVVVATPQSLVTYPYNVLHETETVVIDEADIQIDKRVGKHGRKDPLFQFINYMLDDSNKMFSHNRQFVFVGATMPDSKHRKSRKAMPYIRNWIPDIKVIKGTEAHMISSNLDMIYIDVEKGNKLRQFINIVSQLGNVHPNLKILVFANTIKELEQLYNKLTNVGNLETLQTDNIISKSDANFPSQLASFQNEWLNSINVLHRDISRDERIYSIDHFNNVQRCILLTTDVSARGVDFKDVDVVLQYDFAKNVTDMIHRVGRTARMGNQGKVINFVTEEDKPLVSLIQDFSSTGKSLDQLFSRRRGLGKSIKRKEKLLQAN